MRAFITSGLVVIWGGLMLVQSAFGATVPLPVYHRIAGAQQVHVVTQGETLGYIAVRYRIKAHLLAIMNQLADVNRLHLGQRLLVSNRRIVPSALRDGLVINAGDLMLYELRDDVAVDQFPVGLGRAAWETPAGYYTIIGRRHDPVWHVPPSIQKEMQEKHQPVKKTVPPGPDNPLGKYWLQLSVPGYGIHGTNAPGSIGKYTTHGCIRAPADDVQRLYRQVPDGTAVEIVNEPVKVAQLEDGRILLEAHAGVGNSLPASASLYLERLRSSDVANAVDFAAAERVLREVWGIAIDVSNARTP